MASSSRWPFKKRATDFEGRFKENEHGALAKTDLCKKKKKESGRAIQSMTQENVKRHGFQPPTSLVCWIACNYTFGFRPGGLFSLRRAHAAKSV